MVKRYSTPKEYLDAAKDPAASAEELQLLAHCEYNFVHIAVATHPNCEAKTLEFLLPRDPRTWNEQSLTARIAAHPRASSELLRAAAGIVAPLLNNGRGNDHGMEAGIELCSNVRTPLDAIESLLRDPRTSTAFRRKLTSRTARNDVLALLVDDRSETVRSRARAAIAKLSSPGSGQSERS